MKKNFNQACSEYLQRIRQWLSLGLLAVLSSSATAATVVWTTGDGGNGLWSNTANWVGGSVPNPGDSLTFGSTAGTTALTNDLASLINGLYLGAITFDASAPAYTIGGNAIIGNTTGVTGTGFTSTSFVVNSASNVTQTINTNFTLYQNSINISGAGNLTFGGSITKGATWNPFVTMNGTGVLTFTGSGLINSGGSSNAYVVNSGTVMLSKTAAGAFNPNGLTINGGLVKLGASEQLKASGNLTLNGGTLDLNGFDSNVNGGGTGVATGINGSTGGIGLLTGLGGRITNNAAGTGINWLVINNGTAATAEPSAMGQPQK